MPPPDYYDRHEYRKAKEYLAKMDIHIGTRPLIVVRLWRYRTGSGLIAGLPRDLAVENRAKYVAAMWPDWSVVGYM